MKMNKMFSHMALVGAVALSAATCQAQTFQKPFSSSSIWNKTIPANASYVPCNLGILGGIANDREWIYQTSGSDPYKSVFQPEGWEKPGVYIPDNLLIPDEANGSASFLMPDGVTVREYNALKRTTTGSNPIGYYSGDLALSGDGIGGGHTGGSMSAIGGSIRAGEMESSNPISHALKIELDWAVLYRNSSSSNNMQETFRWPALNSDGNYPNGGGGNVPNYTGTNPALRMGSLCALPKNLDLNSIGLSAAGKKIAQAFKDYGAYVVDTTGNHWLWGNGGYTMSICEQGNGASSYFAPDNGYYNVGTLYSDMSAIYSRLVVVDSNKKPGYTGRFRLVNKYSGSALHCTGDQYLNYPGCQWVASTVNSWNSADQVWNIEQTSDGYYRLVSGSHGSALHCTGEQYGSNAGCQWVASTVNSWNSDEQKWSIVDAGGGYVRIINKNHGTALHCTGEQYLSYPGCQWVASTVASWNSDEQKWQLQAY